MKFSYKILLGTILIMAASFGFSGYSLVNFVFETSLKREINQAMDEISILQFAFETAALNVPSKYGVLQDTTVEQIASNLEKSGQITNRLLRISDEEKQILYASDGFTADRQLLQQMTEDTRTYQVIQEKDHYYIQTGILVKVMDRSLYLETMKDATVVFEERIRGFSVYRQITLVILAASAIIMFFIAFWLTKPIRLLAGATKKVSEGDYSYRAKRISNDELGILTTDFNQMANALEENVDKLKEEIRSREDFIAAFAHELKTPLTAIIGYADLLRSRKLDEEKRVLSANYIYTEGKRLETMSFRLLDIIVTKRDKAELQMVKAEVFFEYLQDMFEEDTQIKLVVDYDKTMVYAEANLIKSVLLNLVDNAYKASAEDSKIELFGRKEEGGYCFIVKDYGVGIPKEEQKKITEAFYMVDKSRSRSRNGAGLGLALCSEILNLHQSKLQIESTLGEGTCIKFVLPDKKEENTLYA